MTSLLHRKEALDVLQDEIPWLPTLKDGNDLLKKCPPWIPYSMFLAGVTEWLAGESTGD